ncbi:MAG TPA: zinc transporter ZupT [Victivallales bacterium]|nr:zinc transporter ZupT [Victivallales bacterium]
MNHFIIAITLTFLAGMATALGSVIAFFAKKTNYRFLSVATGFSAGVMLYVSFVEIFFKGLNNLSERYGEHHGAWINIASFFGGILLIAIIDNLIPSAENPHEIHQQKESAPLHDQNAPLPLTGEFAIMSKSLFTDDISQKEKLNKQLLRMGLFTAVAIIIHNFPEGLATFLAALQNPKVGTAIAVAIALHNIPEGISVSVPIFYATGNRKKAFIYSVLSGLAEPVGAVIAFSLIKFFLPSSDGIIPKELMGITFGVVAGIMVYISLDELLPTSRNYGKGHDSLIGLVTGMLIMAISLQLMK